MLTTEDKLNSRNRQIYQTIIRYLGMFKEI
jgi:hypothetical protein